MARHGFSRGRRSGPKREFSWLEVESSQVNLTAIGGTIINTLTTAELARRPFTIVRTYLEVWLESDQAVASEFQLAAIGFAVVSEQAAAAGVASVPTPVTDAASDHWFLHQFLMSQFLLADATGFVEPAGRGYSIDSKAMRKVDDGDQAIIVVEMDSSVSAGLNVTTAGRVLIKNH